MKTNEKRRFLLRLVIVAGGIILCRLCVIGVVPQHGNGMYPAVRDGDLVLSFLPRRTYHAGAVAVYRTPDGTRRLGRIAAMPGDLVDITEDGHLLVNGIAMTEDVFYPTIKEGEQTGALPLTVPEDAYYLLNDYRQDIADARSMGAVPKERMRGEVFWLFRLRGF